MCTTAQRCSCQIQTIADLVHCAVHHSGTAPKQIADRLGVRVGYLLDAANVERDEVVLQARLLIPLVDATKRYDLLQAFAALAGGVFFRMLEPGDSLDFQQQVATVSRVFSELLAAATATSVHPRAVHACGRTLLAETARLMHIVELRDQHRQGAA